MRLPRPARGAHADSGSRSGQNRGRSGGPVGGAAAARELRAAATHWPARERVPRAALLVIVLILPLAPRQVRGREKPQVVLSIDDCVAVEQAQVRHLLSLELGAPLEEGATAPGATRAAVTCRPPAPPEPAAAEPPPAPPDPAAARADVVELRVDDAVTGKSLWRSIELQKADPGVRARLLSLALSELIFASWAELLVTPEPAVPPAQPGASAAARQATSVQIERKLSRPLPLLGVQLSVLGAAFVLGNEPAGLFGGGARLTGDHRYHLGWDFDVLFHYGTTATALGTVTRDLLSARAALLFHHRVPYLTLRGGLGGRLGATRLSGEPANPTTTLGSVAWGAWGGPLLTLGLSAVAARLRLDLSVEAGYVVSPVAARVGGLRAAAVEGTWFGVQLGIGGLLHRSGAQ